MQEIYEHEISFIDLGGRVRICQHLQLLAIRLVFIIKRSLIMLIFNRYTPFGIIMIMTLFVKLFHNIIKRIHWAQKNQGTTFFKVSSYLNL